MPKVIKVPAVPAPTARLCWKQAKNMDFILGRCDRRAGHKGPHTWESWARVEQLQATVRVLGKAYEAAHVQLKALRSALKAAQQERDLAQGNQTFAVEVLAGRTKELASLTASVQQLREYVGRLRFLSGVNIQYQLDSHYDRGMFGRLADAIEALATSPLPDEERPRLAP